jgi:hypothetical protein
VSSRVLAGLLLVATVGLAGCTGSGGRAASRPATSAPAAAESPSPSASPTPTPAGTPSPTTRPALVLEPDGLGVLVGEGSIRHFPFETTTADEITAVLRTVLGPGKSESLPECGQGPRSSYVVKGFSVLLNGTKFVGWTDQGAPGRRLTAADGTGIGMSLRELRALRPGVTITNDTLGPEFSQEGPAINGFLNGSAPTSTVTSVYAGETCFFR